MQIESNLPSTIDVEARLDQIAKRYKSAGGVGINVLNVIGGSAEGLIDKLPSPVRRNLESATVKALGQAMKAATSTRSMVPDQKSWLNQAVSAAMGAAGEQLGQKNGADRDGRRHKHHRHRLTLATGYLQGLSLIHI